MGRVADADRRQELVDVGGVGGGDGVARRLAFSYPDTSNVHMLRAIAIIIAGDTGMFKNGIVAVAGAALVLGSFLIITDASAAGRGGHGATHAPAVRADGQIQRPTAPRTGASHYTTPSTNGGNFGMSGPYIGTKFIGNQ